MQKNDKYDFLYENFESLLLQYQALGGTPALFVGSIVYLVTQTALDCASSKADALDLIQYAINSGIEDHRKMIESGED